MVNPRSSPKDWSPLDQYGPRKIFETLEKIAPGIAFDVEWEEDQFFDWDGAGPDPREEGFVPHDVDVYARAIQRGDLKEGRESLGGAYDKPDELDPDIHGYLPQMLDGALEQLETKVTNDLHKQVQAARKYLKEVSQARYKMSHRG